MAIPNLADKFKSLGVSAFKNATPIKAPSVGNVSMTDFLQGSQPTVPNVGSQTYNATSPSSFDVNMSGSGLSGLGSLLGGVGSIVGGLLSYSEQKKANKLAQRQFNEMMAFQKDQYYNAVYNRMVDANRAGIHPLAALGVSAHGSASPTAHAQAATGLGQAVAGMGAHINDFFNNIMKIRQLDLVDSQIATNKALGVKYSADAGRAIADTQLMRKDLSNYHLYRAWNSVNNSIGAVARGVGAYGSLNRAAPVYNRTYSFQGNEFNAPYKMRVY